MERFTEVLNDLAHAPDYRDRASAAILLGKLAQPLAIAPVVVATRDPHETVRRFAAEALGNIRDKKRGVPALMALLDDEYWMVRIAAAKSLVQIGDPVSIRAAMSALAKRLSDPDWLERNKGVRVLGGLGDLRAVPYLIDSLDDPHEKVRSRAAIELGGLTGQPGRDAAQWRSWWNTWRSSCDRDA